MLLGILLTLLIIVCVCLVVIILMQRSEGGALGMGGGGGQFLSTRGTGDLLTRTTQILGAMFFILSLAITWVTGHSQGRSSILDKAPVGKIDPTLLNRPAPAPAQPGAPADQGGGFQAPTPSIGQPAAPAGPANPFENLPPPVK